ncbi:MAG: TraB/GumN family protein [Owenweeksia sp.]|nr:TraB/GumN family protein [Owenweeksia sp.]
MTALVDDRNLKWLEKLRPLLDDGNVFVAVGALHLPGENGLITLLRKEGYEVRRVR